MLYILLHAVSAWNLPFWNSGLISSKYQPPKDPDSFKHGCFSTKALATLSICSCDWYGFKLKITSASLFRISDFSSFVTSKRKLSFLCALFPCWSFSSRSYENLWMTKCSGQIFDLLGVLDSNDYADVWLVSYRPFSWSACRQIQLRLVKAFLPALLSMDRRLISQYTGASQ